MTNNTILNELTEKFWTNLEEMVEDIEEAGFTVDDYNNEYIEISDNDDEDEVYLLYLGHANRTIWIEKIREMF